MTLYQLDYLEFIFIDAKKNFLNQDDSNCLKDILGEHIEIYVWIKIILLFA